MTAVTGAGRPSSILVYLSGALGDTLLGYPALHAVRTWAPAATLTVVGRPAYLIWAQETRLMDAVIDSESAQGTRLVSGDAGALPHAPQLAVIWSSAARTIAAGLVAAGSPAVLYSPARPAGSRHQSRYLLDCLRPIGISQVLRPAPAPPTQPLPPQWDHLVPADHGPVVLLHAGAGARWKRWPLAQSLQLARRLRDMGLPLRWSFGPAEADLREQAISSGVPEAEIWPDLPLATFARLLAHCGLLVSADCGVAHLAALLRTPQVTLFGPTDPRRWRPLSRLARLLQAPALCGGIWPGSQGTDTAHQALQRCSPPDRAGCRCLASLPVEPVFAACDASWMQRRQ